MFSTVSYVVQKKNQWFFGFEVLIFTQIYFKAKISVTIIGKKYFKLITRISADLFLSAKIKSIVFNLKNFVKLRAFAP